MSCMVHCVDRIYIEREVLELVCRMCVYVCVLELAGPVSVHALEPVSYSAALSGCFSLKLPDSTANTTRTHISTHAWTHKFHKIWPHPRILDGFRVQMGRSFQNQYFSSHSLQSAASRIFSLSLTLSSLHCVTANVCDHMRKGVHVRRRTVGRTPSFFPPSFRSLSLFLLHHSVLPEAKPAILFICLSHLFLFSPLFSPTLQPSFVAAQGGTKA